MPPPLLKRPGANDQAGRAAAANARSSSLIFQARNLVTALLFDRRYFVHLTSLLLIGELFLGLLIIRFIPYTKIDWEAYMQHVECFLDGERDYSQLQGETGGAVYPALFLYSYTALYKLLPSDPDLRVRAAQYVFLGLYLVTFALVAGIYHSAGSSSATTTSKRWNSADRASSTGPADSSITSSTYPQALLIPLCLSKRLHSIYMLRLFNDPLAMLFLYAAIFAMTRRMPLRWTVGVGLYSLALGVKMNILLFLPGLLVLLVQYRGLTETISAASTMAIVQILLPAAFFLSSGSDAKAYFNTAFNFSRQFVYKWTVNWRFVPEETFLSDKFAKSLLCGQLFILVIFALFKWSPIPGGTKNVILNALSKPTQPAVPHLYALPRHHLPLILFTSNLIGIAFARSLHYQFHSWCFHQIPFLLYSGGAWGNLPLGVALWLGIEYSWATYPSTNLSSGILSVAHAIIISSLLFSKSSASRNDPSSASVTRSSSRESSTVEMDSRKVR